ncbi:DUF1822 family protein [Alkalinema sp. FACHB-956]|uniref:DUF1822 family protein n=1 Tax=Alkalinema sp. FACHB-956 TaxID=2692768 RepID=UPI00168A1E6A|nr:DUF1822 family protein [Alkalinema sp. FACHB-956]MBD2328698.1 DUF1822 family protein [Alkalinema sp. FACHB-956]
MNSQSPTSSSPTITIMDSYLRSTDFLLDADLLLDYEPLQGEIVPLEDADFSQAQEISQRWGKASESVQSSWAIYLHALAIQAFQHWFKQRTTSASLDLSQAIILLPETAESSQPSIRSNTTPPTIKGHIAVCRIKVATFNLCLIVTDGSADDWCIPASSIHNPQFASHFYLPIVLHEESGQAEILGFLRHDQLPQLQETDRYCRLAIEQANPDLDEFLLYLTCLDPVAIALPQGRPTPDLSQRLRQLLVQPVVRTGQWLHQQVDRANQAANHLGDAIATELAAWQVLPAIDLAPATRELRDVEADSPMGDLSAILMSLMRKGIAIPLEKATAYQDVQLGDLALRLYAVIAPVTPSPESGVAEWSLLVILRQQDRADLPRGLGLQIADASAVLIDRQTETTQSDFLYGSVTGELDEQFTVTLQYQNQTITLPNFAFT